MHRDRPVFLFAEGVLLPVDIHIMATFIAMPLFRCPQRSVPGARGHCGAIRVKGSPPMLSENAVAVLRFEIKGYRSNSKDPQAGCLPGVVRRRDHGTGAGVPNGITASLRMPGSGVKRFLRPPSIVCTPGTPVVGPDRAFGYGQGCLRRHLNGDEEVTDSAGVRYRGNWREVGIMFPVSGFATGPESRFRFAKQGWERRIEFNCPPFAQPDRPEQRPCAATDGKIGLGCRFHGVFVAAAVAFLVLVGDGGVNAVAEPRLRPEDLCLRANALRHSIAG